MSSFWRAFYGQVEYAMRCRELRTLFMVPNHFTGPR